VNTLKEAVHIPRHLFTIAHLHRKQYLSRDMMVRDQQKKMSDIIQHAYTNVGYYKELFDKHSILPSNIKTLNDLKRIPISTRSDIQKTDISKMISKKSNPRACFHYTTGGSTGVPLSICLDASEMRYRHIFAEYMYFSNGFSINDKTLRIFEKKYQKKRNLFNKLGIMDRQFLVLDTPPEKIIQLMNLWKPDLLISYPSKIIELARTLKDQQGLITYLRGIFTSGEVITGTQRSFIEELFGAQVYDYYAANECGVIGWECGKHEGYHLNAADVIVEIVDENGKAVFEKEGRVIVTTLSNLSMPFIRYELGDLGILTEKYCSCGRKTLLIEKVIGRSLQFVKFGNEYVNPWYLTNAIEQYAGISRYQIVQENEKEMVIKIVPDKDFSDNIAEAIISECMRIIKKSMRIRIETVDAFVEDGPDKYVTVKNNTDIIK
jgi:phenylacetate-CoA ligase